MAVEDLERDAPGTVCGETPQPRSLKRQECRLSLTTASGLAMPHPLPAQSLPSSSFCFIAGTDPRD
jgi:hypothetical protein